MWWPKNRIQRQTCYKVFAKESSIFFYIYILTAILFLTRGENLLIKKFFFKRMNTGFENICSLQIAIYSIYSWNCLFTVNEPLYLFVVLITDYICLLYWLQMIFENTFYRIKLLIKKWAIKFTIKVTIYKKCKIFINVYLSI